MRRRLWFLLAVACLLTAVGCAPTAAGTVSSAPPPTSDTTTVKPQESPKVFALAYSKDDTLNPFVTKTEGNLFLASLLYDSLTVIDAAFMPQLSLAKEVTPTDATHLTVTLRDGAVFSDGSAVTPADVKASFDAAKKSENYRALLADFESVAVDRKSGVLTFTMTVGDPNAAASLSFPVIKAAGATVKAGEAPIGGGAYVYTVGDSGAVLSTNPQRTAKPPYESIPLRHLPNTQSTYYGFASGNITYYYNDLNTGEIPRVSGASAKVNMNALVYLGINSRHAALSQPAVRQALSRLVDRKSLASTAYLGWATAATTPFHPVWGAAKEAKSVFGDQDLAGALKLLDESGQKKLKLEMIYSLDSGNRATLVDMVRTQLESAGMQVTATPLKHADYMARLKAGQYDLYIGEIRLAPNMDLNPLLGGGEARYGVATDDPATLAYRAYRDGTGTMDAFLTAFGESMPYIPLCWRDGLAAYDRRLVSVTPHGFDPYYNFIQWH